MDLKQRVDIQEATLKLLKAIGEDPEREGLVDTPARVARFWTEFISYNPGRVDTAFESVIVDQMVILRGIQVYSMCEHHLLPFWCDISIGYLTEKLVVGVSKLARIAQKHAHKLQMQERLCNEIALEVAIITGQPSVAVLAEGQHMCMMMRGVRTNATMVTSVTYGKFREKPATRAEFMRLVKAAS